MLQNLLFSLTFFLLISPERAISQSFQSPYKLSLNVEVPLSANAIGFLGASALIGRTKSLPSKESVLKLDPDDVNKFDRGATRQYHQVAAYVSDAMLYSSVAIPLINLANKDARKDFGKVAAMGAEALMLNFAIANFVKELACRKRPLLYNSKVPLERKMKKDNFKSFFSGHTSTTATMSFFFAKTYSDYNPHSKLKPLVWTSCALFPAITGFLRFKAGKHFWTDIITGYAVGVMCGLAVPYLHSTALTMNQN